MRKVGIALVVVVLLAVLATPLIGGLLARRAHAVLVENLDQVEASTMGAVRITNEGFELGWLSSKARMRVELGPPGSAWTLPLVHVIHHGPLPVAHASRGFSMAFIDTTIEGAAPVDGKLPLESETVIGMRGDLGVELRSAALPRRPDLAWDGGTAQLHVADQGKRIAMQASAPRFEMHGASGDIVLEAVRVDYTAQRTEPDAPSVGSASYALGHARVTSTGQRELALDGLSWTSSSAFDAAGKLDTTYALRLQGADVDDRSYRDVGIEVALRNLDAAAARALGDIGSRIARMSSGGVAPDQIGAEVQTALMQQMPALLASSPEIEVKDMHVDTVDGRIDGQVHVLRDPGGGGPGPALQLQGRVVLPVALFGALTLRAAGEISPAARQANETQTLRALADQIADQLLTRGYFKEEEDGRLSSEFSYGKGALVLNGQEVTLGDLILATGALPQ